MARPLTAREPDAVEVACEQAARIRHALVAEGDLGIHASYTDMGDEDRPHFVTDYERDSEPWPRHPLLGTDLRRGDGGHCRHWATAEGLELLAPRGGAT